MRKGTEGEERMREGERGDEGVGGRWNKAREE